jgi:hypothetical protein
MVFGDDQDYLYPIAELQMNHLHKVTSERDRKVKMILPEERKRMNNSLLKSGLPQHVNGASTSDLTGAELQAMWNALDQEQLFM